jgi:2-polyprenyl-3-methyl-5-hydroxy-6-metoxy-1,4-benzoquinol methylase
MLTNEENIKFQAEKHPLKLQQPIVSLIQYLEYLMHSKAYGVAANYAKGKTVLDYGCNVGYGTNIISTNCKKVIGLDVSTQAIDTARKNYQSEKIEFRLFNGIRTPFENDSFGMIVSLQVMEHIVDIKPYLLEIQRLIDPQGTVIITTPNAAIRLEPGMKPWNKYHVREFTAVELLNALSPYFSRVVVKGLFAKSSIYQTLFSHYSKKKAKYRKRNRLPYKVKKVFTRPFKAAISSYIKPNIQRVIGQNVDTKTKLAANRLDDEIMKKYSTSDFYYSENNPEQGLDLIAICSGLKKK